MPERSPVKPVRATRPAAAAVTSGQTVPTPAAGVGQPPARSSEKGTVARAASGVAEIDDNTWLFTQAPGTQVIHLFTLLNRDKALRVAAQEVFQERAHVYTTRVRGQEWVFVLLGPYATESAALRARESLPPPYPEQARVRDLATIAANRCAKRSSLAKAQARGLDAYCLE